MTRVKAFFKTFDIRIITATLVIVCVILASGYKSEYDSCERAIPPRAAIKQFAKYQTVFQGGLVALEHPSNKKAAIVDPDTNRVIWLTKSGLRRWIKDKQNKVTGELPIPDCHQVIPGR